MKIKRSQKGRKYYRKCGICGQRDEQSNMIRTYEVDNGWCCVDCWENCHADSIILHEALMNEF